MKKSLLLSKLEAAVACPTPPHEACKSRWGFHGASWETFQKLRLLNYLRLDGMTREANLARWEAKLPCNRVVRREGKVMLPKPVPIPMPKRSLLSGRSVAWIYEEYWAVKMPVGLLENVVPVRVGPAVIDEMLVFALTALRQETGVVAMAS